MIPVCKAFHALNDCVEQVVVGDRQTSSEETKDVEGSVGEIAIDNEEDYTGDSLSLPLLWLAEPSVGVAEGGARIEVFYLREHLGEPVWGAWDSGVDVMEDQLDELYLGLESCISGDKGVDSCLKWLPGRE